MSENPGEASNGGLDADEIQELRSAISALRRQLESGLSGRARSGAAEEPGVDVGEIGRRVRERLDEFDPIALYRELRARLSWFPLEDSTPEVDEFGLDARALRRAGVLLDFLFDRWWRIQVSGSERIPLDARTLFVANRSGILPYDGLMIAQAVERHCGAERRPRFMVADWLAGLPFSQPLLARLGGVRACAENAERLLRTGRWVVAFPEGQKGALKPFHARYRLQRFARGGFVSVAVRQQAVIVPVAVVGGEEVHPILYQSSFATQLLGIPALVTATFPHLGPLGLIPLPSQWRVRFGDPISFDGIDPRRADDPLYVNRTRERIRSTIQSLVDREVRRRRSVF